MIEARTYVKFLRHLGIALIFAPEPFTTPFGVALVLFSRYLSRRHDTSQNNRLRETVKYYMAHTRRFSDDADGTSTAPGSVRHIQVKEHAILGQITGSPSFIANSAPSVWQNWQEMRCRSIHHTMDMQSLSGRYKADDSSKAAPGWSDTSRKAEKVIRHTINLERLSRRYEGGDSATVDSNRPCTSGAVKGTTHHSLNMILLSQCPGTCSVRQAKAKHHNINMSLLRQRYGSAVSSTRVLNALQNKNFYYDIVSRRNVIAGN